VHPADDRIQRRSQLVRGGREEFILQVAGLVQLLLAHLELSHRFRERLRAIGHLLLHRGERLLKPGLGQPAPAQFERKQESCDDQDDGDEELVHLKHDNPCNRCSGTSCRICPHLPVPNGSSAQPEERHAHGRPQDGESLEHHLLSLQTDTLCLSTEEE
jgi:hypothetical protein